MKIINIVTPYGMDISDLLSKLNSPRIKIIKFSDLEKKAYNKIIKKQDYSEVLSSIENSEYFEDLKISFISKKIIKIVKPINKEKYKGIEILVLINFLRMYNYIQPETLVLDVEFDEYAKNVFLKTLNSIRNNNKEIREKFINSDDSFISALKYEYEFEIFLKFPSDFKTLNELWDIYLDTHKKRGEVLKQDNIIKKILS